MNISIVGAFKRPHAVTIDTEFCIRRSRDAFIGDYPGYKGQNNEGNDRSNDHQGYLGFFSFKHG
jgi:hypothetical protein